MGLRSGVRGLRPDVQLRDRGSALPDGGSVAVGAGVATTDDDHVLACGGDATVAAEGFAVGGHQIVHSRIDTSQIRAWNRQGTWGPSAGGHHDRVKAAGQLGQREVVRPVTADGDVGPEADAFAAKLHQTTVQNRLFHLELGDPVAQQTTDRVVAFVDQHGVTGPAELLRHSQTGRTRAHDGHRLAREPLRLVRRHQAVVERAIDDRDLDLLDRDGRLTDAQHAGRLTRSRAQAPGELREVVGGVQPFDCLAEVAASREFVPLGDEVAEGTPLVAERDAAVHAAASLAAQHRIVLRGVHLLPVHDPHRDRPGGLSLTVAVLQEAFGVSHVRPPGSVARRAGRPGHHRHR